MRGMGSVPCHADYYNRPGRKAEPQESGVGRACMMNITLWGWTG